MTDSEGESARWRPRVVLAVTSVLAIALGVAWGYRHLTSGEEPGERVRHVEGKGPLSMASGGGGVALDAPGPGRWWGTVGEAVPCVEGVSSATITAVRYAATPEPLEIRPLFTFTPPKSERDPDEGYGIFGWSQGHYPDFEEARHDVYIPDSVRVSRELPLTVDVPCEALPAPDEGWIEMLTEIKVDRGGTHVPSTYIDYEVDGREYTLEHRWSATMCGSAPEVVATGNCPQEDGAEKRQWDENRSWDN